MGDFLTVGGVLLAIAAFLVAMLAYLDARREARIARREREGLQRELKATEQNLLTKLPPAIVKLVRHPDSETAEEDLKEAVAESLEASSPLLDCDDPDEVERVRTAIEAATEGGGTVRLEPPAKKVRRRGPGGYTIVVGTQSHGLWSASKRLDGSFIARQLAETTSGKAFGYEDTIEPSERVGTEVSRAAERSIVYFTDRWRRKERGSQRWVLRDSTGEWWRVDDVYRTGTAFVERISLTD